MSVVSGPGLRSQAKFSESAGSRSGSQCAQPHASRKLHASDSEPPWSPDLASRRLLAGIQFPDSPYCATASQLHAAAPSRNPTLSKHDAFEVEGDDLGGGGECCRFATECVPMRLPATDGLARASPDPAIFGRREQSPRCELGRRGLIERVRARESGLGMGAFIQRGRDTRALRQSSPPPSRE
eukprot:492380-Rhodomonas_salina.1